MHVIVNVTRLLNSIVLFIFPIPRINNAKTNTIQEYSILAMHFSPFQTIGRWNNDIHFLLRLRNFRSRELRFPRFTWMGRHKFRICVFTTIPPFPRSNVGKIFSIIYLIVANYTAVVMDKAADASLLNYLI